MKAVVIIPTYNEKGNIEKMIPFLEGDVFPKIKEHDMAILIADDNSPDGTADVVRNFMKKWKNVDISQGPKKGLGSAYIRGMDYAIDTMNADVVFEMDADFQHDATKIPQFMKKIDEGYDMVLGTRYSQGGSIPENWPIQRKAFSIIANLFVRTVFMKFSIHDWTGGYRALRKEVFLKEKKELTNFSGYIFQISFLHKAVRDGFKIAEVPFHFSDRTLGSSKIAALSYIINVVTFVITARIKELERVIKFLFVGGTGFLVQLIFQEGTVRLLHVSHPFGVAVGAESAILSNFFLNNFWTFSDTKGIKQRGNFFVRLIKFNIASFGAIIVQYLADFIAELIVGPTLHIGSWIIPTRIVILFPTIIFIVIPMNYIIYNVFIWKTKYLKNEATATA